MKLAFFQAVGLLFFVLTSLPASANNLVESCLKLAAHKWEYENGINWDELTPEKAMPICREANAKFPKNLLVSSALARIHNKLEDYPSALRIINRLITNDYAPALRTMALQYEYGDGVKKVK